MRVQFTWPYNLCDKGLSKINNVIFCCANLQSYSNPKATFLILSHGTVVIMSAGHTMHYVADSLKSRGARLSQMTTDFVFLVSERNLYEQYTYLTILLYRKC